MLLYSKKIIKFLNEAKVILKDVLSKEVGLRVFGDRFYDKRQEYSYPIKVVVFNNKAMLGYFDSHFYEIGLHECLMQANRELLHDIIRHELAHYMTFISFGNAVEPHGGQFRAFCLRMGWGERVWKASICFDESVPLLHEEENNALRKVQKLLALTASNNKYEAEQAMIKSQQLLLKHNIDAKNVEDAGDEKIFLKRIMKQKKENAKMRSIAHILETFFVNTVYRRSEGCVYLEIIGSATNIEIAEYVAGTLQTQLDLLWKQTQKEQTNLKGVVAKNSFFLGVAKGYCDKINFLKKQYDHTTSNALVLIEKKLQHAQEMVYERLTKSKSNGRHCSQSSRLGEQAGKGLSINPAVKDSGSRSANTFIAFARKDASFS